MNAPPGSPRGPALLCLTGGEHTVGALAARLEAYRQLSLQEVRLDLLDRIDDEVFALLRRPEVIVTCRGEKEGGRFRGTASDQYQILARALSEAPGYVDVEVSTPAVIRQELFARRGDARLILSLHRAHLDEAARLEVRRLAEEPADVIKVAIGVEDAAELREVRELLADERRPVVRIGMGQAGILSRALPERFGSVWTYVVPDGTATVAPGQLTLSQARAWRVDEAEQLTPLALLGGPQVMLSPGPTVYNRLFRARHLPFLYLPVVTARPEVTLLLLEELGGRGASVTMPAKEVLASQVGALHPPADRLRAVNTIRLEAGRREGFNTDVEAVRSLLAEERGEPALILGAGGAARAAAVALDELGCEVAVTARREEQAQAMARELKLEVIPWARRGAMAASVRILVNATPCGADERSSPVPEGTFLGGCTVLDMVIPRLVSDRRRAATPLLDQTTRDGGRAIIGVEMWLRQGARQMSLLVDQPFTVEDLREHLDE